ncbi:methionyl-tRNA formyltransferase [Brochothrix thermosphacta]|uniref:methionyl-tRNA formyltransferase n=1 Tax=Brochothrix thermosphacta TaxID=2756 RepID=UPI0003E84F1A|nr:methionyl-tRNA formyltransferase [Brochothrix thermosphacta]SLM94090.1 Methionyl-tRNA formyltransferase [Brachybacterium faecium]ANZ94165.1 methionyl-tRNA formyltransferase [Brochothrix thermosphacta]ANZ97537.1 methionyl-tRNA formyltransferase [Brochothrix thermosphacta]EUJ35551.1 methionyl-tRNA formyltransferase [Brochothrix thermosphacta DSM 20171 = FSL F6-1036]ODJ48763.1 methionyl-tRNA formyltransferase [Brochothrix thermosphacta DSM 20171 = FSL F6-1036]
MTKIIFMGTPDFAVPVLQKLIADPSISIEAVVTQPDRKVGRKHILTPTPVKKAAVAADLNVLQPEKLRTSEELETLINMDVDLLITAAYGQILPNSLLEAPRLGAINVHASLLPKLRGGAPIHYALIEGHKEAGVTIMYMAEKLDAGDMLSQSAIPIEEEDNVGTLFEKLSIVGADLLVETLPAILDGSIVAVPQNEAEVTFARNISREQERIDWNKSARAIFNHVRGMNPFPSSFTTFEGGNWKIWEVVESFEETTAPAGTIVSVDQTIRVAAGDGKTVDIKVFQPAGKQRMTTSDYLRGSGKNLEAGKRLGE